MRLIPRIDLLLILLFLLFACTAGAQTPINSVPPAAYQTPQLQLNAQSTNVKQLPYGTMMQVTGPSKDPQLQIKIDGGIVQRNGALLDLDNAIYFPRKPDFAGYVKLRVGGVTVYMPVYFDLDEDETAIGPLGPIRP